MPYNPVGMKRPMGITTQSGMPPNRRQQMPGMSPTGPLNLRGPAKMQNPSTGINKTRPMGMPVAPPMMSTGGGRQPPIRGGRMPLYYGMGGDAANRRMPGQPGPPTVPSGRGGPGLPPQGGIGPLGVMPPGMNNTPGGNRPGMMPRYGYQGDQIVTGVHRPRPPGPQNRDEYIRSQPPPFVAPPTQGFGNDVVFPGDLPNNPGRNQMRGGGQGGGQPPGQPGISGYYGDGPEDPISKYFRENPTTGGYDPVDYGGPMPRDGTTYGFGGGGQGGPPPSMPQSPGVGDMGNGVIGTGGWQPYAPPDPRRRQPNGYENRNI